MIYLNIWHGSPLSKTHVECVESVKRFLMPEDEYIFIGDCDNKYTTILYEDFINDYLLNKNDNELINLWNYYNKEIEEGRGDVYSLYNFLRFYYASLNDDVFYTDVDLYLNKLPIFNDNRPYFGKTIKNMVDTYIFYSGKNRDFFRNILLDTQEIPLIKGIFKNLLRTYYSDKINRIENDYFNHRSNNIDSPEKLFKMLGFNFGETNGSPRS